MFKSIYHIPSITILARLSDSLSISINSLNRACQSPEDTEGFSWSWAVTPEDWAQKPISAQYWFFSPGLSYITAVLVGSSNTTMPMTGHRSCWSRPGSWDCFLGLGQDSHKLAWWSALLADPGCHLLVCIACVVGSNAGCVNTLSFWLPVI